MARASLEKAAEPSPLQLLPSQHRVDQLLADEIRRYADDRDAIRILEAGCGRRWGLDLEGVTYHLTGVDTDELVLRHRREVAADLDEWILGDLRTITLPREAFDVVYSSFVLEHVRGAELALDRMVSALKPGGLLLLVVPDRDSVFGFLTRKTPHRLHVLYRRWVQGHKSAGTPAHGPFPTVYDLVVSRRGIHAYCDSRRLALKAEYGENSYLRFFGGSATLVDLGLRGIAALSRGRLSSAYNNLILVIEK